MMGFRQITARALLCALVLMAGSASAVWAASAKVTHVTDGDTLWVLPQAGGPPVRIRIDGIDAPEICQTGGPSARDALAARVKGRTVELVVRGEDDYGRTVAGLVLEGEDMAAWMVEQGHAWSYRGKRGAARYASLQQQAQAARRGIFADASAMQPRKFRQRNGSCHP
jgi:micrococcal nuclease